jgi:hypothetical protein
MGMKSAACWFAPRWRVRTKAFGEEVERTVRFDIAKIVKDNLEELDIEEKSAARNEHFTEVALEDLHHIPVGRTFGKIKEHLTDIYRVFLRNGTLQLRVNGESLIYVEQPLLVAPYYKDQSSPRRLWRKEILFDLGDGLKVTGFAALRDPGNYSRSGFALFRRGRLIEGSGEDGYRPPMIFGTSGSSSYARLRLFGELHLEGFQVSHTKDGFRWDENEEPFLELLKEHLDRDDLPLLAAMRALPLTCITEGSWQGGLASPSADRRRAGGACCRGLASCITAATCGDAKHPATPSAYPRKTGTSIRFPGHALAGTHRAV